MINALLNGIFKLIMGLVSIVMAPIDIVIENTLPDLSTGINAVGQLFELIKVGLTWAVQVTGLNHACISLIVAYWVFRLTVPLAVHTVKMALKWYNMLKP